MRERSLKSQAKRRVFSIRWIVTGVTIALTAVAVLGVGVVGERNARQALTRELGTRLMLEARKLALASSGALLSDFPELTLHPILTEMEAQQPELAFAVVVDPRHSIQGHADSRKLGTLFEMPADLGPEPDIVNLMTGESLLGGTDILVASAPVLHPGGGHIGTAVVGFRRDYIDSVVAAAREKLAIVVSVLLGVGVACALLLMSSLLRPVAVLRQGLERIGKGDLETPVEVRDRTELGLLAETINEMSAGLRAAQKEMREKERLAHEVELAREIQSSLLPSGGIRTNGFVVTGAHQAAAEVGGDYYDIFSLPDGRVGVAIADVSGKGLGGCLVTSMLSALVRAFRLKENSPRAMLIRLEETLSPSLRPGTFITMFYGLLEPESGRLTYASAGHSPTLIFRRGTGGPEWLRTKGIPLGAVRGGALAKTLEDSSVEIGPGDLLVQYTDGINEAFDTEGEQQFGFSRIEDVVSEAAGRGAEPVVEGLLEAVRQWRGDRAPDDDETLLVLGGEGTRERSRPDAPHERGSRKRGRGVEEALRSLAEARQTGHRLEISADLDALGQIHQWLEACPLLAELGKRETTLLESGLYEACANIVEHGYQSERGRSFELWWMPPTSDPDSGGKEGPESSPGGGTEVLNSRVGRSLFVIVDHGVPFEPGERRPVDVQDPAVRRRGRGLGLKMIHATMSRIAYHPGTGEGNITVLAFDPARSGIPEEVTHVS